MKFKFSAGMECINVYNNNKHYSLDESTVKLSEIICVSHVTKLNEVVVESHCCVWGKLL